MVSCIFRVSDWLERYLLILYFAQYRTGKADAKEGKTITVLETLEAKIFYYHFCRCF